MKKIEKGYKPLSLADKIYQNIYKKIVSGELKPGTKITEMGLSQSEGTSRSPVREALKRLADDRLVTLIPKSSCYISRPTPEEVEVLFEIRRRLECLALEYAFNQFDKDKLVALKQDFNDCYEFYQAFVVPFLPPKRESAASAASPAAELP